MKQNYSIFGKHIIGMLLCLILSSSSSFSNQPSIKKIIIGGVCRNVAKALKNIVNNCEQLGKRFADYRVIIYENNSTDKTAEILKTWAAANKHVTVISEYIPPQKLSPIRTVRIANARNMVLEEARKKTYEGFDYFVMADLDFQDAFPIDAIVDTIHLPIDWDCVSSNGLRAKGPGYRDRYAFRSKDYPLGPELLNKMFWTDLYTHEWFSLYGENWLPVYSAFGGLALYKTKTLTQFSYSGTVTEDLAKYYEYILNNIPADNKYLKKYLQKIHLSAARNIPIPVVFCRNTLSWQIPDTYSIACCEHLTLHASMAVHGFDKFYVNPQMVLQYSRKSR